MAITVINAFPGKRNFGVYVRGMVHVICPMNIGHVTHIRPYLGPLQGGTMVEVKLARAIGIGTCLSAALLLCWHLKVVSFTQISDAVLAATKAQARVATMGDP